MTCYAGEVQHTLVVPFGGCTGNQESLERLGRPFHEAVPCGLAPTHAAAAAGAAGSNALADDGHTLEASTKMSQEVKY